MTTPALPERSAIAEYIEHDEWRDAFGAWLFNLNSARTREDYRKDWDIFLDVVQVEISAVTQSTIVLYKNWLTGQEYAASTIARRLCSISSFYSFAIERGLIDTNPCAGVKKPPVQKYGKARFLKSEQEVKALLDVIPRDTIKGKRDYALILFMLSTAVRSMVPQHLKIGDIYDFNSDTFTPMEFTNKGGKVRTMPLPEIVREAITDYLRCRENISEDAFVFQSTRSDKPLSNKDIRKLLHKWLKAAGLNTMSPHALRHTAISLAAKKGWSIVELMDFSTHSDMQTLSLYLHTLNNASGAIADELARRLTE